MEPNLSLPLRGPLTAALIVDLNSPFITKSCHLWLHSPAERGSATSRSEGVSLIPPLGFFSLLETCVGFAAAHLKQRVPLCYPGSAPPQLEFFPLSATSVGVKRGLGSCFGGMQPPGKVLGQDGPHRVKPSQGQSPEWGFRAQSELG